MARNTEAALAGGRRQRFSFDQQNGFADSTARTNLQSQSSGGRRRHQPEAAIQRAIELHPFQVVAVADLEQAIAAGQRRLLLVAPTGSGKTVIASEFINRIVGRGDRVLVIAHRREIIRQTRDRLVFSGLRPGIVLAGFEDELRPMAAVQVAGIQTLHARAIRSKRMPMPVATHIIIDECHHARASTYEKVLDLYPDAIVVGLTATPVRGDGRGLGNIFETMIEAPQVAELIDGGFLVRSRVYAPVIPNLAGVKTQQGDYVVGQLEHRMNTDTLVGNVVVDWVKTWRAAPNGLLRCRRFAFRPHSG